MDKTEDETSNQSNISSTLSACVLECQHGTSVKDSSQSVISHETACAPLEIENLTHAGALNKMVSSNDKNLLKFSDCLMVEKNNINEEYEKGASAFSRNSLSRDVETSAKMIPEQSSQSPIFSENHHGQLGTGIPEINAALCQSDTEAKLENMNRSLVDIDTGFESVKDAVSKFGGITDWKAHKARVWERRRTVQQELEKIRQEIPQYKKRTESAEDAKAQVLKELDETRKLIEELKMSLEKVQTEEEQVKQDAVLAEMRVKEMEQGIAGEASVAFKVQIDVAKSRHAAAVAELASVKGELEALRVEHARMINEREDAFKTAEAAAYTSKDKEKAVEDLTLELIIAREALESAHTSHMEAEENRIGVSSMKDKNALSLDKELKLAEDELKQLSEKLTYIKDLRSKLKSASTLLVNLKGELAAYMEAQLNQESHDSVEMAKEVWETHTDIEEAIACTKKEIQEIKTKIEKAKEEANILRVAAASLQSELEIENSALSKTKEREGSASSAVSSLEAELNRTKKEIELFLLKEREAKDQMMDLPKALQQATFEADEASKAARIVQEELKTAKEEAEQIKDSASTIQSRLDAALKEIEAAQASERLALTAARALQESDQATALGFEDDKGVTISFDEYCRLSKRARDAEELAKERVTAVLNEIEVVSVSESRYLQKVEETWQEIEKRKEALRSAVDKSDDAKQEKLEVEQGLRMRRSESERHLKAGESSTRDAANTPDSPWVNFEERRRSRSEVLEKDNLNLNSGSPASSPQSDGGNASPSSKTKKKKSLFPRIVLFLSKKK